MKNGSRLTGSPFPTCAALICTHTNTHTLSIAACVPDTRISSSLCYPRTGQLSALLIVHRHPVIYESGGPSCPRPNRVRVPRFNNRGRGFLLHQGYYHYPSGSTLRPQEIFEENVCHAVITQQLRADTPVSLTLAAPQWLESVLSVWSKQRLLSGAGSEAHAPLALERRETFYYCSRSQWDEEVFTWG